MDMKKTYLEIVRRHAVTNGCGAGGCGPSPEEEAGGCGAGGYDW